MSNAATIITWLVMLMGIAAPVYFSLKEDRTLVALALSLTAVTFLTGLVAWWGRASIDLELWWLGVVMYGMRKDERVEAVPADLKDYAEDLYWSPSRMGIAWQLSALMMLPFFSWPYAICAASLTLAAKRFYLRYRDRTPLQ